LGKTAWSAVDAREREGSANRDTRVTS
jgi:hypothetical protein